MQRMVMLLTYLDSYFNSYVFFHAGGSAKKYYYFMRMMGQEPSHTTLEVALKTKPNYVILSEEITERGMTLGDVVREIADVIQARAAMNKNYGTVLIPEGVVDAIPELKLLISELDSIYTDTQGASLDAATIRSMLTVWSRALLDSLPDFIQSSFLQIRGTDKSIQLSQLETEKLLQHYVALELSHRKKKGLYKGSFSVVPSFLGYQIRGSAPSNFDITYAYNLGYVASALVSAGLSGYLATISSLKSPVAEWKPLGVPITALMSVDVTDNRKGSTHAPAVLKARVDLHGPAYAELAAVKEICTVWT